MLKVEKKDSLEKILESLKKIRVETENYDEIIKYIKKNNLAGVFLEEWLFGGDDWLRKRRKLEAEGILETEEEEETAEETKETKKSLYDILKQIEQEGVKVYIRDPSEAPQGVKVYRGKRGGYYYYARRREAKVEEKPEERRPREEIERPVVSHIRESIDSPTSTFAVGKNAREQILSIDNDDRRINWVKNLKMYLDTLRYKYVPYVVENRETGGFTIMFAGLTRDIQLVFDATEPPDEVDYPNVRKHLEVDMKDVYDTLLGVEMFYDLLSRQFPNRRFNISVQFLKRAKVSFLIKKYNVTEEKASRIAAIFESAGNMLIFFREVEYCRLSDDISFFDKEAKIIHSVTAHELGHLIHHLLWGDLTAERLNNAIDKYLGIIKEKMYPAEERVIEWRNVIEKEGKFLTDYESEVLLGKLYYCFLQETFAESVMTYLLYPDYLKEKHPRRYEYLKKYLPLLEGVFRRWLK
ncbi:hypothetical protein JDFR1000234_72 [uncultured archaeal virus]|uniref:Uncharacterized protein n=1 Tax=uncultured archaeal virus TaxID=1960247 RepID=A0A1S5Y345_9VIRU|nr:hypothetical protein JDFR1000234_72 [uncultured archaeal virus]